MSRCSPEPLLAGGRCAPGPSPTHWGAVAVTPAPPLFPSACTSSETESEAGDVMDQPFEEMHNKLNSVTDPTGFLRMVSRNNLFNRYGGLPVRGGEGAGQHRGPGGWS